ncbi:MAG: hypothetical protein PVG49_20395, partial [Desulfobacteraceae bacterium]
RFEPAKTIEIEDDSLLGLELPRLTETGELDREKLERGLLAERLAAVDWADEPVDEEEAQLQSASPEKRDAALDTLAGKMSFGNTRARDALVRFLESLPPPGTLSEVHFKIKVLRLLERSHTRQDLVPILIRDIFRTRSNNTTRQWITAVFCFLERTSIEFTREPLERMLQEKRFSSRLKKKIKHILYEPRWE